MLLQVVLHNSFTCEQPDSCISSHLMTLPTKVQFILADAIKLRRGSASAVGASLGRRPNWYRFNLGVNMARNGPWSQRGARTILEC